MKDEEMAEQFADNISGLELTCSLLSAKDKSHSYRLGRYDGFLAGLKAGRPQWHKVADGDLPEIGKPCFVYLANDYVITARLREDNIWTTDGHNAFENVIAWCEIPTFDKE